MPADIPGGKDKAGGGSGSTAKERVGTYFVGKEIGRGSFATVYRGHKTKTQQPIAVKAVSRQKLTTKLLESLESEINILKAISHRNIVALEDCFKNDTHIYLVMEFCSGSDLSIYIKNRGKLPTLDFVPRGSKDGVKVYWDHPAAGGLDERVTRCLLGQLAEALKFLRSENLIHRDIKPQNLLMQPATDQEVADGHPLGIPILKVADFGFARILPAAAMAETLCGSPLYMAPEILRYEKYDAKADLWSVGAVLFEMTVGRPPFRASNHVELLRRIEKGEDRIKFPDESSRATTSSPQPGATSSKSDPIPAVPVSGDIKALIRGLLKRQPGQRMGFEGFFASAVWEGFMVEHGAGESTEEEGSGSLSLEVSTDSSRPGGLGGSGRRVRELVESAEIGRERVRPARAIGPVTDDPALQPQTAPSPPTTNNEDRRKSVVPEVSPPIPRQPVRRSEPKYYVSDNQPSEPTPPPSAATPTPTAQTPSTIFPIRQPQGLTSNQAAPRPIQTPAQRRLSMREASGSVEDAQPITPSSNPPLRGSPLAATPPMTRGQDDGEGLRGNTGKDESALEGDDSVVGREYVVVEKTGVVVNSFADTLEQASRRPGDVVRRQSSQTHMITRPASTLRQPSISSSRPGTTAPMSYSPPFALSTTPPFAVSTSRPISRPPSIPQSLNAFPPQSIPYDPTQRISVSPSSLQTGALARALTNTALRIYDASTAAATTALSRATSQTHHLPRRASTSHSRPPLQPLEQDLIKSVEDLSRKAYALFDLADARLQTYGTLARSIEGRQPNPAVARRKSSSSSFNSEVMVLRQQEVCAGEAVVLYNKGLGYVYKGIVKIQGFWEQEGGGEMSGEVYDLAQWLRGRFNDSYEKTEWAKARCSEELPFVDRLIHDKAREISRNAAIAELQGDFPTALAGYESALWLLHALLDDVSASEVSKSRDEDKISIEKVILPIKTRLEALGRKMDAANVSTRS